MFLKVYVLLMSFPIINFSRLILKLTILGVKLYFRFRLKERTVCVCELDKI